MFAGWSGTSRRGSLPGVFFPEITLGLSLLEALLLMPDASLDEFMQDLRSSQSHKNAQAKPTGQDSSFSSGDSPSPPRRSISLLLPSLMAQLRQAHIGPNLPHLSVGLHIMKMSPPRILIRWMLILMRTSFSLLPLLPAPVAPSRAPDSRFKFAEDEFTSIFSEVFDELAEYLMLTGM